MHQLGENDAPYMISDWKKAIGKKRLFAKLYAKSETEENFELKKEVQKTGHERAQESNYTILEKSEKISGKTQGTSSTLFSLSSARKLLRITPSLLI